MTDAMQAMAAGGQVVGRLFLWRDGAHRCELTLCAEAPMVVDCEASAAVKQKLRCTFYYDGKIDFAKDRLAPFLCINGQQWPLGQYVVGRCQQQLGGGQTLWQVTGLALTQLVRRHVPETMAYWPQNTPYTQAVAQLLAAAGITESAVTASTLKLTTPREDWPLGTNALTISNALLYEINYHSLFCTMDGLTKAVPFRVPGMAAPTLRYPAAAVANIHLPGAALQLDGPAHPNVFYYTCENPEFAAPLSVKVENQNPASPFSVANQGRVPVFRTVANVASEAALTALAQRELQNSLLAADEITFTTGLCPLHAAFDVVQLEKEDFIGTVHETHWKMTLAPGGVMQHRGRIVAGY